MGSCLLSQLQELNINVWLYWDDGLAITNATPRDTENIKKKICHTFNNNRLRITIEANKQIINFLDVTFNLNWGTYQPFTKPNTSLQYVHHQSNHPPITRKNIPASINKWPSSLIIWQIILWPSCTCIPESTWMKCEWNVVMTSLEMFPKSVVLHFPASVYQKTGAAEMIPKLLETLTGWRPSLCPVPPQWKSSCNPSVKRPCMITTCLRVSNVMVKIFLRPGMLKK